MSEPALRFNLLDERWIAVLDHDGHLDEVSLREVFARAPEIRELVGEVPTQSFAMLRLLLAVMHRALDGPPRISDWERIRADWPGAVARIDSYLASFRHRFDLLDPAVPFFQVATLRTAKGEVSGLERLIADVPNGNPFFTTRLGRGLTRISWAEAARWLVHVHAFDPGGIRSGAVGDPRVKGGRGFPIGPGWAGQIGGISLVGDNLYETLCLNLVVADAIDFRHPDHDLPPWERPQLTECEEVIGGREPRGLVDLYTWQTRRVRLVGDSSGVTGVVLAQGDRATPQNRHHLDPMTAFRFSEPQSKKLGIDTYMPALHQADRQFWRGLASLLGRGEPAAGRSRWIAPGVVQWINKLQRGELLDQAVVRVRATGALYGTMNATLDEIVDDQLVLPVRVLAEPDGDSAVQAEQAVEETRKAVEALASFALNLARASGASRDSSGPAARTRELAYAALDRPFRDWLTSLASDSAGLARRRWHRTARALILTLSDELVRDAATAAWVGRTIDNHHIDLGQAEAWFRAALARALPQATAPAHEEEKVVSA